MAAPLGGPAVPLDPTLLIIAAIAAVLLLKVLLSRRTPAPPLPDGVTPSPCARAVAVVGAERMASHDQ